MVLLWFLPFLSFLSLISSLTFGRGWDEHGVRSPAAHTLLCEDEEGKEGMKNPPQSRVLNTCTLCSPADPKACASCRAQILQDPNAAQV